jgi:hypothetical protein
VAQTGSQPAVYAKMLRRVKGIERERIEGDKKKGNLSELNENKRQ